MFIISTSLPDLVFEPGQPIPNYDTNSTASRELGETTVELKELKTQSFLQTLLPLSAIIIFLMLIICLIKMKDIKRLLKLTLFLIIPLLLAILLNLIPALQKSIGSSTTSEGIQTVPIIYNFSPSGAPSESIFKIVGIGLLIILVGFSFLVLIKKQKEKQETNSIADEADIAIKAIEEGRTLENVIIYCYMRMSEIIIESRGIEREPYLTPREFEIQLVSEGIPLFPIQQLTKLFEEIRYGNKSLDQQAKKMAVFSLMEIRNYLRQSDKVIK